ncbi:MAG: hypothetical protein M5U31_06095 [Acidimicrobiia bacterium]|nr:hypothetical protein [Acidimicrobiia bacterium]
MEEATESEPARRRRVSLEIVSVVSVVVVLMAIGAWWLLADGAEPTTHTFVVPAGAEEQLRDDPDLSFFPRRFEATKGDTLVIENRDDVLHTVGPYTVDAGQTLRQRFDSTGTFTGLCTLHPDGEVEIVVGVG